MGNLLFAAGQKISKGRCEPRVPNAALAMYDCFRGNRKLGAVKRTLITPYFALAVLVMAPAMAFFVWWCWAHFVQSPLFARTYFEGLLEFDDVAESRRWHWGSHPSGGRAFGCSYAIVNISKTSSSTVPENWSGQWSETPVPVRDGDHGIIGECKYLWPDDLNARLSRAHDNSGSYYSTVSETLFLYSPVEGIAARIRFGD